MPKKLFRCENRCSALAHERLFGFKQLRSYNDFVRAQIVVAFVNHDPDVLTIGWDFPQVLKKTLKKS